MDSTTENEVVESSKSDRDPLNTKGPVLITEVGSKHGLDTDISPKALNYVKSLVLQELSETHNGRVDEQDLDSGSGLSPDHLNEESSEDEEERPARVDDYLDEEYDADTDLEMDYDEWLDGELDTDTTGKTAYIQRCNEVGVIPVTYFLRHVADNAFIMRFHGLGPLGAKAIAKPLQNNTTIEILDLQGNHIERGCQYIARSLRDNVYITDLILSENCVNAAGARAICTMLEDNRYISKLDMSGNAFKDAVGVHFAEMLKDNRTVVDLRLHHNEFEMQSAKCFSEALATNETLQYLDLSWNHFHETEGRLIAEGVMENYGLKRLDIRMNGLGLEGGAAIGKALMQNRTLVSLDIRANRIPKEAASYISRGLQANDVLQELKIGSNPLKGEGALTVMEGFDKSESSALIYLDFGDTRVTKEFELLEQNIKDNKADVVIIHGGVMNTLIQNTMVIKEDFVMAFNRDPMTHLRKYLEKSGLRMIDFFKQLDRDCNMTLSKEDFIKGVKHLDIDLTEKQIGDLVDRMDNDRDGIIDYREFVNENNEHRLTKKKKVPTATLC